MTQSKGDLLIGLAFLIIAEHRDGWLMTACLLVGACICLGALIDWCSKDFRKR